MAAAVLSAPADHYPPPPSPCWLQVVLVPESIYGSNYGPAVMLNTVTTQPANQAPQPNRGMQVSPVVGPDRFGVQGIAQDKPGFVYMIITKPVNQDIGDVGGTWGSRGGGG